MQSAYFDFLDWHSAFSTYDMAVVSYGKDKVQFVVSEHPYTSGYWIEDAGNELSVGDCIVPFEHVAVYKCRIHREIQDAKNQGRTPRFIRYNFTDFQTAPATAPGK